MSHRERNSIFILPLYLNLFPLEHKSAKAHTSDEEKWSMEFQCYLINGHSTMMHRNQVVTRYRVLKYDLLIINRNRWRPHLMVPCAKSRKIDPQFDLIFTKETSYFPIMSNKIWTNGNWWLYAVSATAPQINPLCWSVFLWNHPKISSDHSNCRRHRKSRRVALITSWKATN